MPGILDGKVSLITGAGSGIGRATSMIFAREGARLVLADVVEAGGHETLRMVKELGADSLDAGPLFAARFFEPAMMGLVYLAYGQKMGGRIGLRFLHT